MSLKSWFLSWWQSDARKIFTAFILKALRVFLGSVADRLQSIAKEEVDKAEATGKSGIDKYKIAFSGIRERIKDASVTIPMINLAIESAVIALD